MQNHKKPKSSPIADYLRPVIDAKYRIRYDAAEDLRIDQSVLSRILSGKRPGVSEAIIERICDKLGLDKEEGVYRLFLTKHPKMRKLFSKPNKPIPFRVQSGVTIKPEALSEAYNPVPMFSMNDLAKTISINHRAKEHVLIPSEIAPKDRDIKCCRVKDDSMSPTLQEGSLIAVNLDDKKPKNKGLFLLKWRKEIMVRRVQKKDGYILFGPDNPDRDKYPIIVLPEKKKDRDNPIIGKIIWAMEKI